MKVKVISVCQSLSPFGNTTTSDEAWTEMKTCSGPVTKCQEIVNRYVTCIWDDLVKETGSHEKLHKKCDLNRKQRLCKGTHVHTCTHSV